MNIVAAVVVDIEVDLAGGAEPVTDELAGFELHAVFFEPACRHIQPERTKG